MKRGGSVSGAVSLIMIFCVLCLAVFATLTVATAERERKLSELTAQNAASYYAADAQAMEIVSRLKAGQSTADMGVEVTAEALDDATLFTFQLPVGDSQQLDVAVYKTADILPAEEQTFQIVRWQTVYSGSWEPDDSINIWSGD